MTALVIWINRNAFRCWIKRNSSKMSDFRRQDEVLPIRLNSELIRLKIEINFLSMISQTSLVIFCFWYYHSKCNITFLIWSLGVNLKPNTWVLKSYNKKFGFHFTLYKSVNTCMYIHCIAELVLSDRKFVLE